MRSFFFEIQGTHMHMHANMHFLFYNLSLFFIPFHGWTLGRFKIIFNLDLRIQHHDSRHRAVYLPAEVVPMWLIAWRHDLWCWGQLRRSWHRGISPIRCVVLLSLAPSSLFLLPRSMLWIDLLAYTIIYTSHAKFFMKLSLLQNC